MMLHPRILRSLPGFSASALSLKSSIKISKYGALKFKDSSTGRFPPTPGTSPCLRWNPKYRHTPRRVYPSVPHLRTVSTKPLPVKRGPAFRFLYRLFAYTGAFGLVTSGLVVAFFAYDASTYREDLSFSDIPVSATALNPRTGGPKNLPIAEVLVDDEDCVEMQTQKDKPKLVILGCGWGSVALLKSMNPGDYHITVVSPDNYFLFTPMLPSATVGTLELRSLAEPIRRIVQRVRGHFLKAEAVDVELSEKLLEVSQTTASGERRNFYLPYDKLIIGVGMTCCNLGRNKILTFNRVYHKCAWG